MNFICIHYTKKEVKCLTSDEKCNCELGLKCPTQFQCPQFDTKSDKNNVWKVKVVKDAENLFEQLCEEQNIKYVRYSKPFEGIYKAECEKDKLLDIGYCISTLEEMPEVSLN